MIHYIFRDETLTYADYFALEAACFPGDAPTEKQFANILTLDYWTARDADGTLAGFMYVKPIGGNLHITHLETAPAFRRQGIATNLLALAEAHARNLGYPRLTLRVLTDNAPAQAAYLKFGFAFTGRKMCRFGLDFPAEIAAEPLEIRRLQSDGAAYSYAVEFLSGGRKLGSGVFNEELGGCKDFYLENPESQLPGAMAALLPLVKPELPALYLMTDDADVIAACASYPLRLQSEILDMAKELR